MFLTFDDVMSMAKLALTGTLVPATDDIKTDSKKKQYLCNKFAGKYVYTDRSVQRRHFENKEINK